MFSGFGSAARETTANETPTVEFISRDSRAQREAKSWTFNMLNPSDNMIINNNHVIYLDQGDHKNLLSLQTKFHVHIKEFFRNGNGGITITGNPSDVSCAAIEVESMLCKAQEDFAQAEECDILFSVVRWSCKDVPCIQTPEISAVLEKAYLEGHENHVVNKHKVNFIACGLCIEKVEKLENIMLQQLFEMNRQRVKVKPKCLYQRVSAQFCDLICRVGFQKEFAPPAEQKYGSGIYFSSTVDGALRLWKEQKHEQYIYIIQAQVLTGTYTIGSPQMILPPPLSADPLDRFDSLTDMGQTHIIFSGQQALPEYLVICTRLTHLSADYNRMQMRGVW
uniref:Poly(ADP-ribose) polymerase family member 9 n=1 Tax=Sinocyclocheilus anshuiensis TaxID=1608454 RepID=A0A671SRR1_9TELE